VETATDQRPAGVVTTPPGSLPGQTTNGHLQKPPTQEDWENFAQKWHKESPVAKDRFVQFSKTFFQFDSQSWHCKAGQIVQILDIASKNSSWLPEIPALADHLKIGVLNQISSPGHFIELKPGGKWQLSSLLPDLFLSAWQEKRKQLARENSDDHKPSDKSSDADSLPDKPKRKARGKGKAQPARKTLTPLEDLKHTMLGVVQARYNQRPQDPYSRDELISCCCGSDTIERNQGYKALIALVDDDQLELLEDLVNLVDEEEGDLESLSSLRPSEKKNASPAGKTGDLEFIASQMSGLTGEIYKILLAASRQEGENRRVTVDKSLRLKLLDDLRAGTTKLSTTLYNLRERGFITTAEGVMSSENLVVTFLTPKGAAVTNCSKPSHPEPVKNTYGTLIEDFWGLIQKQAMTNPDQMSSSALAGLFLKDRPASSRAYVSQMLYTLRNKGKIALDKPTDGTRSFCVRILDQKAEITKPVPVPPYQTEPKTRSQEGSVITRVYNHLLTLAIKKSQLELSHAQVQGIIKDICQGKRQAWYDMLLRSRKAGKLTHKSLGMRKGVLINFSKGELKTSKATDTREIKVQVMNLESKALAVSAGRGRLARHGGNGHALERSTQTQKEAQEAFLELAAAITQTKGVITQKQNELAEMEQVYAGINTTLSKMTQAAIGVVRKNGGRK
jgi:hypothetical protein